MSPKPFLLFVLAGLLTGCLSPTPASPPTSLPVSQPSATPSLTPSPTPPPFGHFSVVDGAPQVWDGGQYLPLPQDANLEGLTLQQADGGLVLVDADGQARLRLENGLWLEVVKEVAFLPAESLEQLGERFTYDEASHELTFISPIDGSLKPVPLTWSEDGQSLSVNVNGETIEFGADQLSVFLPYKRPADRMLVLTAENNQRIVWNEFSGQWIKDEWKTNTELTESMLVNFDPLVWARLNGDHFPYAQNSGLYGKVFSNAGPNSAFYIQKSANSNEQFQRVIKKFPWTERNGKKLILSIKQIFNVNNTYSYILDLDGSESYANDPNYFRLELGYGSSISKNIQRALGANSLVEQLLSLPNKMLINDNQPSTWTQGCYLAWFEQITPECERAYYTSRPSLLP